MSKKLKLTDREWREFVFGDLFDISSTSSSIDKKRLTGILGNNPYITRSENNNGIDSFIDKQACFSMDEANVITIGLDTQTVFYQSFPFYTGQNIQVVRHPQLNKYNALFVIRVIKILVQKFSWGSYGATLTRLRRGKLFLPVDTNHLPDWAFMEAFMKQVEDELLSEVRPKLEAQLLEHIISLGALEDREWREFYFSDVFTRVERGKRLKKGDHIEGTTPYVSSTAMNNGIDGFVGNRERVRIFSDCISLANSGSVGNAFFQEFEFVASDHVTSLQKEGIDKYAYLFMLPIISRLSEKYSFNREINDLRISRERLMLPIQADGTPDWEFMSAFMKKVDQDTLSDALRYFNCNKCKQMLMGGGKMRPFFMEDILYIVNGVRLTKADMTIGNRPFVGASEVCNGITEFVDNANASIDKEVLGVNYNGSVGFSFYHLYEALFSDDVKRVRWKDEDANNKYTLLYLSTAIAQQRSKYAYGYKFNAQRMKRQIIMLPSQADGIPDYAYMEQTMRVMEYDVLRTYLNSINV
ncbi:restriction endonuclease subunit S [Bacteroides heparinolyticus]|uniref:restriction endonuclease subunit S n=3 Tax=Prevotella heparinolytica TaxID=28113 RepID=UPI0023F2223E|nr:restriction endonuclease subunit S [Bacteroides heparinolyticus]